MDTFGLEQARQLAEQRLASDTKHDFVISETSEHEFGWVFIYVPRKFVETGNTKYLVPGANPLVVNRDGKVETLSNSMTDTDIAIANYLKKWRQLHPKP